MGTDGPDQKGAYPLDRSTVDRWTGSAGAGPRACVMLASALRQPSQSRSATWHTLSPSAGCLGSFAKRTSSFRNSQPCPSTYRNPFS
jgi:hypothetical protein